MVLSGCTEKSKVDGMVYYTSKKISPHPLLGKIYINLVESSQQRNILGTTAGIDGKTFKTVVEKTLNSAKLSTSDKETAPYFLDVLLTKASSPSLGEVYVSSTVEIHYRLFEKSSNKEILNESIISEYTAPFKTPYTITLKRQRAFEGAIKSNMKKLTQHLKNLHDFSKVSK